VSAAGGALAAGRFGFFGAIAAVDLSEPDFLSLTAAVVVDLLLPLVLSGFSVASLPPEAPLLSPGDPEDWDDSVEAGDEEEEPVDESDDDVEEVEEAADDEESDVVSDDEFVDAESVGSAHATPGVVATATPTPKATAKPPTRPTYFAYPITTASQSGCKTAASAARTSSTADALWD
jgi:hypothetical protein